MSTKLLFIFLQVLCVTGFVGCNPFCVENVDSSVQDGWQDSFQIKIDRIPESCALFGAIAGANYVIASKSKVTNDWQQIIKIHFDDPLEVPSDRIGIINESVGYAYWVDTFVVTTDGGRSFSIWETDKDLADFKLPGEQYPNWATITAIKVYKDGSGEMTLERSENNKGAATKLSTLDFGKNWTPLK